MFKKMFTVKNNSNMRNSDRRKLVARAPAPVAELLRSKSQAAHVRAVSFDGSPLHIFTFDKQPMIFEVEGDPVLFPSVYLCWLDVSVFPTLLIHDGVLKFLANGADLMLPGVIRHPSAPFPEFARGAAVAISSYNNGKITGPVAVGRAVLSSMEMIASGMQGRGVQILHLHRDALWEFGTREPPPQLDVGLLVKAIDIRSEEDFPALGSLVLNCEHEKKENVKDVATVEGLAPAVEIQEASSETAEDTVSSEDSMEDMLYRVFLCAVKYRLGKSTELPFDVGQFYSQCLLPCVPSGRRLDMKKTKYKKFAAFLSDVNASPDGWIVRIEQKAKGIDNIAEVNWEHPALTSFRVTDERSKDKEANAEAKSEGPVIHELLSVTEAVAPFFRLLIGGAAKGDRLSAQQLREQVTHYVKTQGLQSGKKVKPDTTLAAIVNTDEEMDWNTLMQKIQSKMTKTFVLQMPDGREIVRKMNLPKIVFKVESRAGNKKMTLVNNLATYGIDAKRLCHKVQVGTASSASVNAEAPLCEGPQLTVQGNQYGMQIAFVAEMLVREYGLERKFFEGLELAAKKKK